VTMLFGGLAFAGLRIARRVPDTFVLLLIFLALLWVVGTPLRLYLGMLALIGLALLPPARPLLIGLEIVTGAGLGSVMSVMQIVTQTAAGPARLGAAA